MDWNPGMDGSSGAPDIAGKPSRFFYSVDIKHAWSLIWNLVSEIYFWKYPKYLNIRNYLETLYFQTNGMSCHKKITKINNWQVAPGWLEQCVILRDAHYNFAILE